mmetsp:Transcript_108310/g.336626  ORF Transcript_108310/g.336626 Transcript_108310/m.336626 type:complete len:264 (-) Transcript_108310:426-1217(-)
MIDAHAKAGDWAAAEFWLQQMVESGIRVDQITFATLLCAYTAPQGRHTPSSKCSLRAYSAVIKACARVGDLAAVRHWLRDMANAGLQPRQELMQEVMKGCSTGGRTPPGLHPYPTAELGPAPQAIAPQAQPVQAAKHMLKAVPQAAPGFAEEPQPWYVRATATEMMSSAQQREQLEDACRRGERLEAVRRRRGKSDGSKQDLHNQEARIPGANSTAVLHEGLGIEANFVPSPIGARAGCDVSSIIRQLGATPEDSVPLEIVSL